MRKIADEPGDEDNSAICGTKWRALYLLAGFGMFTTAAVGSIVLFKQFSCPVANLFTSISLIATIIFLALSFTASSHGLITAGTVALYCVYLTYTAVISNDDADCNPYANAESRSVALSIAIAAFSLGYASWHAGNDGLDALSLFGYFYGDDVDAEAV